jgi:regulator of CtrA degradation
MTDLIDFHAANPETPIVFAEHLASSETFKTMFKEGMTLVEQTAAYLDGEGRDASKDLERPASLLYATESMRLTTRLMQLASWLLLQRAVNDGEMSAEQANLEKNKVKLSNVGSATTDAGWNELPEKLRALIDESVRLQTRIRHLDDAMYNKAKAAAQAPVGNPVNQQLNRLAAAFGSNA